MTTEMWFAVCVTLPLFTYVFNYKTIFSDDEEESVMRDKVADRLCRG